MPTPAVKTEPTFRQLPVTALMENLNPSRQGLSGAEASLRSWPIFLALKCYM